MRNALIISPFATSPLDTRYRRWTYQTTQLLADAGFCVTFLLLACENGWRMRHQEEDFAKLRAQWGDVIVIYGDARIGAPPRIGGRHQLDEWWDFHLEQVLRNHLARRSFEVCVVHQVWLSRAFDLCDSRTAKVLTAHDLFWRRAAANEAGGIVANGFRPVEAVELFGLERADMVITANERDAAELARRLNKKIVNLPFYDPQLERPAASARSRDRVVFGIAAAHDGAAAASVQALLSAIERAIGTEPAPFDLTATGPEGRWQTSLPIRTVSAAKAVAEFYCDVDCVIAPQFLGNELSPAVPDAAALGLPLLASPEAAAGLRLDPVLLCGSADEMAARMIEIGLSEPSSSMVDAVHSLRDQLRSRSASGAAKVLDWLDPAIAPIVVDLGATKLPADAFVVLSYLSYLRLLAEHRPVLLVLPDAEAASPSLLPPGVTVVRRDKLAATLAKMRGRPIVLQVPGAEHATAPEPDGSPLLIPDLRWSATAARRGAGAAIAELPLLHSNVDREPAALEFRRRWAAVGAAPSFDAANPVRVVFVDLPAGDDGAGGLRHRLVPLRDDAAFRNAALALLEARREVEIAWLAGECGYRRRLILQICALRGLRVWAMLDAAAAIGDVLPHRTAAEFDHACEDGLRELAAPVAA